MASLIRVIQRHVSILHRILTACIVHTVLIHCILVFWFSEFLKTTELESGLYSRHTVYLWADTLGEKNHLAVSLHHYPLLFSSTKITLEQLFVYFTNLKKDVVIKVRANRGKKNLTCVLNVLIGVEKDSILIALKFLFYFI